MTSKVVTIEGILNADKNALAEELAQVYDKWRIQKCVAETEWKEIRNYIFATDTKTTSNSDLPWKNTTTVPKLAQIRDNLHANYMDALFPNDDWLIWEGDDEDSVTKEKRIIIQQYAKNKARSSGLRETVSSLVYDYIDYGNMFAEVIWVDETHTDPVTKEIASTYKGPKVRRISPYDHVFDPTATDYNKSPKFTRYLKSVGELKKEIKTRPDLQFDEKVLDDLLLRRKSISAFDLEDINKAQGYIADGFGTLSEYLGSFLIEIIEFEGDWYNAETDTLMENRIISIVDGEHILRNIENPNWLGTDNKVHVGWRDRPDNLYSMSPLANLIGMQYRIDHLENLKADALDQNIFPPQVVKGEVDDYEWGPGVRINIPEDGEIQTFPPNQAAFQVNNEIDYLMNLMEEMVGAPKQAAGIRTPGEKTAFEVQTLENNAGRIFHAKTSKFEILGLEKIMNLFIEQARRNIDVVDIVKVTDEDFGVIEFVKITKEDLTSKGKLRPIGARHFAARSLLMQNLVQIYGGPLGGMLNPHTSRIALTSMIEEIMGLRKFQLYKPNIGVAEDAATQKLIQSETANQGAVANVPLEENQA